MVKYDRKRKTKIASDSNSSTGGSTSREKSKSPVLGSGSPYRPRHNGTAHGGRAVFGHLGDDETVIRSPLICPALAKTS